jgi:hypothetical protein
VIDLRSNWRQPLLVMFGILAAIYLAGYILAAYSYGRVISFLVMIIDFTIAKYLVKLESEAPRKVSQIPHWPLVFSAGFTVLLLAVTFTAFVSPALGRSLTTEQKSYEPYYFLYEYTDHYDVILADPGSSKSNPIPSFSGKLVSSYNDLPFIPDLRQRVTDAAHFFDLDATQSERQEIIHKYGVQFILLENISTPDGKKLAAAIKPLGKIVYRNNRFTLISVDAR